MTDAKNVPTVLTSSIMSKGQTPKIEPFPHLLKNIVELLDICVQSR